jgi:hypothetical protein
MLFVDGENLTLRAQEVLHQAGADPIEGKCWRRDCFIWNPNTVGTGRLYDAVSLDWNSIRSYYYTSLTGDEPALEGVRRHLWELQFTPRVFKKTRQSEKAKGVDVSLTKDMLSHAFNNHYDVGFLMAGDGDYVPLVEEVKHLGKQVTVAFFSESAGLSAALKLAADRYYDITEGFVKGWGGKGIRERLK